MKIKISPFFVFLILIVLWIITIAVSSKLGFMSLSWTDLFTAAQKGCVGSSASPQLFLLCSVRLPRVLLSSLAGFVLSLAGAVMQGLFRTPLSDPYLLGIASGSTAGASFVLFLGLSQSLFFLPIGALLGGIVSVMIVGFIAASYSRRETGSHLFVLAGVAISTIFSALTSIFLYLSPESQGPQNLLFWLLGSFSRSEWLFVGIVFLCTLLCTPFIFASATPLNLLSLGDPMAVHLGVSPSRIRIRLLILTTLLTAVVVASVGPIGFVGLLVPHAIRILVGPDHRRLLPLSAFAGAIFLTWCDTLARVLFAPQAELPIGIVTSLLGAPFFLSLLVRTNPLR